MTLTLVIVLWIPVLAAGRDVYEFACFLYTEHPQFIVARVVRYYGMSPIWIRGNRLIILNIKLKWPKMA